MAGKGFRRQLVFAGGGRQESPEFPANSPCMLYVHIPFCEKLCPYCSFNRVEYDEALCREYFGALKKELGLYRERGFDFQDMYVGGGTPTIMMDELADLLAAAKAGFSIRRISVETNPNHLTDGNLDILRKAGVNRLSVGVQSFDDGLLKAMDRYEKYGSGQAIAARLKEIAGVMDTLNADMIFNFPGQTAEMLDHDIDVLLGTGVDQVTCYPLMACSRVRHLMEDKLGPAGGGREKEFYRRITDRLVPPYHFSSAWCFSRKEGMIDEYIVEYEDYAGLGSGSIGYLSGTCYAGTFNIRQYIERVNRGEIPVTASRAFSMLEQADYGFLMKLFGLKLDPARMRGKYGAEFDRFIKPVLFAFQLCGAVRYDRKAGQYILTPRGRYYWVIMMREFFTAVNNFRDFCRENA